MLESHSVGLVMAKRLVRFFVLSILLVIVFHLAFDVFQKELPTYYPGALEPIAGETALYFEPVHGQYSQCLGMWQDAMNRVIADSSWDAPDGIELEQSRISIVQSKLQFTQGTSRVDISENCGLIIKATGVARVSSSVVSGKMTLHLNLPHLIDVAKSLNATPMGGYDELNSPAECGSIFVNKSKPGLISNLLGRLMFAMVLSFLIELALTPVKR